MAASACVVVGYPVEYSTMLRDLIEACRERKVDASSSHCVYRRMDVKTGAIKHRVDVNVSGMQIKISDMGVTCPSHQLGDIVVKGCSLGNGGVWLSVAAELVAFWLEIHVPMRECKERW